MSTGAAVRPPVTSDVVAAVSELAPQFRERSPVTEANRTAPRESIEELVDAGVARLLVPREYAGSDLPVRAIVEVTAAAAYGCPSTGWCAAQMAHHPHVVGMFPAEGQHAVWGDGPDVVIASSTAPAGRAERVPGGYRLTGRHAFASGVNNAGWTFVGAMVANPDGPPEWRLFLVDRDRYTVEDTWHTAGMRGTGSNTVVIDDVFVPEGHTLSQLDAREGTGPGAATNADPKFGLPWMAYALLGFTSTMLGAAQGAYDHTRTTLGGKRDPSGRRVAEGQILQVRIGFAAARISTARTLLLGIADRADVAAPYSLEERATIARDNTFASMLLAEAADTLLEVSGTGGFADTSPVQQAWRDIHFAVAHISVNKTETGGRFGRIALGVEETATVGFF